MPDRKEHWERVYRDKLPGEVSWYQQEPSLSLQLISRLALAPDAPIIDIGGGASTLVDQLLDRGFTNISVLDVSTNALAHAKSRLELRAKLVNWYEQDVTLFEPPNRFALWHDRAVFHFLTRNADRDRYISILKKALEPGGHFIIMTFAIGGPLKCSGLDIVQYDANKMTELLGPDFELAETGKEVHETPAGGRQSFAYFRFIFR